MENGHGARLAGFPGRCVCSGCFSEVSFAPSLLSESELEGFKKALQSINQSIIIVDVVAVVIVIVIIIISIIIGSKLGSSVRAS